MKKIIRNIVFLISIPFWVISINAQIDKSNVQKKAQDEEYIFKTIQSLDELNPLRRSLEFGERGKGIHYDWMDEMKKYGVKQVSFVMNFEWENHKVKSITIKKVAYHPVYYQYDIVITDAEILQKIKESGLAKKLENQAFALAEKNLLLILKDEKTICACGLTYENLLDDERLPLVRTDFHEMDEDCSKAGV